MRRRDWKIKKLKKDIFGKNRKHEIKYFFLRGLFIRKNSLFYKKDLAPNFYFYKNIINSFFIKKSYIDDLYFKKNNFFYFCFLFPTFFFSKKIFYHFNNFKNFIIKNDFSYIFIKNSKKISKNNFLLNNNNVILYSKKYSFFDIKLLNNEDNTNFLSFKNLLPSNKKFEYKNTNDLIFFLNFNLYFLNSIEIYKIIILIYILKLK